MSIWETLKFGSIWLGANINLSYENQCYIVNNTQAHVPVTLIVFEMCWSLIKKLKRLDTSVNLLCEN